MLRLLPIVILFLLTPLYSSNALINSSSPYLRQHAQNPINWVAWDDAVIERANMEHKPLFLSIGYSTCHWCHIMARESFEDESIAEVINTYFIPVKIDKEELSHIDSRFQKLHRSLKGRTGGWPLHVLLTEEGEPFWIGTYLPPHTEGETEGLENLIRRMGDGYQQNPDKYRALAKSIYSSSLPPPPDKTMITPERIFHSVTQNYDSLYHGFGKAPKFPEASKISLLLDLGELGNSNAKKMALDVLRSMALGGLYDQSEGGFFRYSTDAGWEIPHFEKMLYNQAELIPLYNRAYQITKDNLYSDVIRETITMTYNRFGNENLFYSASDAESDHIEGGYFLYTGREIETLNLSTTLKKAFGLEDGANFEGRFHLYLTTDRRPDGFHEAQSKLSKIRKNRHYPFIDTKIITAHNAMMIEALYKAGAIDPIYTAQAEHSMEVLLEKLRPNGTLYHHTIGTYPLAQKALLEDYTFLISALIAGYQSTLDESKLSLAQNLADEAISKFYRNGLWTQNTDGEKVEVDLLDKYTTSAFGRMIQNLLFLASLSEETKYIKIAKISLTYYGSSLLDSSNNAPSSLIAWLIEHYGAVTLSHRKEVLLMNKKQINTINYPYILLHPEQRDDFGACKMGGCFANDKDINRLLPYIEELKQTP